MEQGGGRWREGGSGVSQAEAGGAAGSCWQQGQVGARWVPGEGQWAKGLDLLGTLGNSRLSVPQFSCHM